MLVIISANIFVAKSMLSERHLPDIKLSWNQHSLHTRVLRFSVGSKRWKNMTAFRGRKACKTPDGCKSCFYLQSFPAATYEVQSQDVGILLKSKAI